MLDHTTAMNAVHEHRSGIVLHTRQFLSEHGPALEAAARLLGGDRWACRVRNLCAGTRAVTSRPHVCLRELEALLGLLRLERVSDPEADGADSFRAIEPTDPRVHDICLLTEAFDRFLRGISEKKANRNFPT